MNSPQTTATTFTGRPNRPSEKYAHGPAALAPFRETSSRWTTSPERSHAIFAAKLRVEWSPCRYARLAQMIGDRTEQFDHVGKADVDNQDRPGEEADHERGDTRRPGAR